MLLSWDLGLIARKDMEDFACDAEDTPLPPNFHFTHNTEGKCSQGEGCVVNDDEILLAECSFAFAAELGEDEMLEADFREASKKEDRLRVLEEGFCMEWVFKSELL